MPRQDTYEQALKEDLERLIDTLELSDLQKHCLRSRWLDQISYMEGKANRSQNRYYTLRLTVIIGSVVVLALVSLNTLVFTSSNSSGWITMAVDWITIGLVYWWP